MKKQTIFMIEKSMTHFIPPYLPSPYRSLEFVSVPAEAHPVNTTQQSDVQSQSTVSGNSSKPIHKRSSSLSLLQMRRRASLSPSTVDILGVTAGGEGLHSEVRDDELENAEKEVLDQEMSNLYETVLNGETEKTQKLLEVFKGDLHTTDPRTGASLLHIAAANDDIDTVKLLLNSGRISKFDTKDNKTNTALMMALFGGNPEMVELMAAKMHEADPQAIDITNQHGWTTLMMAAQSGEYKITKILLEHGADTTLVNKQGKKALDIAAEMWEGLSINQLGTRAENVALLTTLRLIKLKPEHKFKFNYQASTLAARMLEEDNFALETLHSATSRKAILEMGKLCAVHIKKHEADNKSFIPSLNNFMKGKRGSYPALKKDFKDLPDLLSFFEKCAAENKKNGHIKLMSILWCLPMFLTFSEQDRKEHDEVSNIYSNIMGPTKDYISKSISFPKASTQFGNTGKVQDEAFADNDFSPFNRSNEYISINKNSPSYQVQNYIKKQKPYVSGLSGMMNMTTSLLDLLKMHPLDKEIAQPFCEAMAAFIVGSGMHSYPEVYKALNLHLKLLEARKMRQDDASD